ncbi:hypothetical protein RN001_004833 [Aquatica leii]|uniref:Uncharacterized protein n=1 Tax=Aquatica leii TaxID=1421715 RepID=A0AAN7PBW8_9COLE|nr:hypothetical protein RN001_004833 [Aquatica leii]
MDIDTYTYLLELVTPYIIKENTCMRTAISPHEKLTASLRFLATGRSYKDLEFTTIIPKQSLSEIIPETCKAIFKVLKNEYLKVFGCNNASEKTNNRENCIVICRLPVCENSLKRYLVSSILQEK